MPKPNILSHLSDEEFTDLILEHESRASIQRTLKIPKNRTGCFNRIFGKRVEKLHLSTKHFSVPLSARAEAITLSPENVLMKNSSYDYISARRVYRRLRGIRYECKKCGQKPIWHGSPLVLIFDHKNGDHFDHRPSNLRWLCPNCNSQTDTFCGRNVGNPLNSRPIQKRAKRPRRIHTHAD